MLEVSAFVLTLTFVLTNCLGCDGCQCGSVFAIRVNNSGSDNLIMYNNSVYIPIVSNCSVDDFMVNAISQGILLLY